MPRSEPIAPPDRRTSAADWIALAWAVGVAIVYGLRLIAVRLPWLAESLGLPPI